MKINNRGFALRELLIVIAFFAIIFAFGAYSSFKGGDNRKYEVFAQNARDFATKVSTYRDEFGRYDEEVYLKDLVDNNYIKAYKNPFSGGGDCNLYESKVVNTKNNERFVTLRCGDYLIDSQKVSSSNYKVYKVSKWQEQIGNDLEAETAKLYNYEKSGKLMLNEYVVKREFVDLYNKKETKNIKTIDDLDLNNYNIETKTFYRTKKLVKENL